MVKKTIFLKTLIFFVLMSVLFCNTLFAAGGRDKNQHITAEDPSGFTDSLDITERKSGKYNYYLEAKDKAGNTTRSGPANIHIDPASDLPQATIINPMPFMRVQGNLNIVGIAFDDDDVKGVEFSVHRGMDGKGEEIVYAAAQGADYWSYFLDTSDTEVWTDGIYTITAWATDVNGLSGISENFKPKKHRKHQVYWMLDRKKPDILVTSHAVGALIAGKVELKGVVNDGNGIKNFRISTDGGERYTSIIPKLNKKTGEYTWSAVIESKKLEDGPAVIWFQSEDGNGSLGTSAHLLFVNNTGPNVGIVYPSANATVNGIFSFAGYAQHPVGLKSVKWSAGRQSGEFELLPGNQWFSADVDIRNERSGSVEVEIRAEDVSGNVTVSRQRYRVDQDADLPRVTINEYKYTDFGLVVKGKATDDDGIASILYSANNGASVEIPCSGYFQFVIKNLGEGMNNLEIWAKDVTGVMGPRAAARGIAVPGKPADIRIASVSSGSGQRAVTTQFYTGMTVNFDPRVRASLELTVTGNPQSASVSFGGGAPAQLRISGGRASVQIPETTQSGMTKIDLISQDRAGIETVTSEYIYFNTGQPAWDRGVFTIAKGKQLADGRYLIGSPEEVLLGLDGNGSRIQGAQLSGTGAESLSAVVDEHGRVAISAYREGIYGPLVLSLQTDDGNYVSPQFRVIADYSPPAVSLTGIPSNWLQNTFTVSFNISGANRVTSIQYSMDMGNYWADFISLAELSAITRPFNLNLSRTLDVGSMEDGAITVLVKATDEAGRVSYSDFTVFKDTQAPVARLVMPASSKPDDEVKVNGTIRMGFEIIEAGRLRTVSYNRPAGGGSPVINTEVYNVDNWDKPYPPMYLEVLMDAIRMPLSENMVFTFTDMAGNRSQVNAWDFVIDREMDIPIAHVILPIEDEVITSDFLVSGVMFDDDEISQVYYRIDNGPEQVIVAKNGFSIPILLSGLTDNEHTVTVTAEDIYGVKSAPVSRRFRVSLTEPTAQVTYPLFDTVLMDSVEIKGTSFDRNGIRELNVSLDNGNTFNTVYGNGWRLEGATGAPQTGVDWTYRFNTKILKDGPHVVFIRVYDGFGIQATYASMINVDNTPPDIVLDSPDDGSISVGDIPVMGRVLDPNLENITIELRSLDGAVVPPDLRSRQQEPTVIVKDNLNITRQPDGQYIVVVVATDKAGNVSRTSRNVEMARQTYRNFIEILYPLDNETVSGEFFMYGYAGGTEAAGSATIKINSYDAVTVDVDESGYFRFPLSAETLSPGKNVIVVHSDFGGGPVINSRTHNLDYNADGPWVTIDSFNFGSFAYDRPYVFGRAGYVLSEEDKAALNSRNTDKELRKAIESKKVDYTEISFDNGKTFYKTSIALARGVDYRYRLETGEMIEGMHYILVRSTMKNGETALTRMLVQVDKTFPEIRVISPEAGGRYNQEIAYSASAADDVDLESLTYHLRIGSKAMYEIPGFLQGLYFEGTIPPILKQISNKTPSLLMGATYFDVGMGLSFFDDNVKVQVQYGLMTQRLFESLGGLKATGNAKTVRYGGHVFGLKLLANVYQLPFGPLLGPDWEWLSASFALGANFSLFDMASQGYTQSGEPTFMSAFLVQIEFPKVTLPKRKYLRTFSAFTEGQIWFVPTDVKADEAGIDVVIPHIIMGVRLYIF